MFRPTISRDKASEYERQRRERAEKFHAEQARSEVLQCRITVKEKELIEKNAQKFGLTVSEYVRACTLTGMLRA